MIEGDSGKSIDGGNMSLGKVIAGAGAWAWNEFGQELKPGFLAFLQRKWIDAKEDKEKLRELDNEWRKFNWGKASERYQIHMRKLYGHIRVLGSTEPIYLDEIFTDVFLLEKPQAFRRFDMTKISELQQEPEKLTNEKRLRGLQVVVQERGHRLYVLGKPGSGKTTFLKYLVHQTLEAQMDKIPILVTLRDWASSKLDLLSFVTKQFDICDFPDSTPFIEYLLETGQAIVLFDGLDEVPDQDKIRSQVTNALHDFCRKYQKTQIIITCRIAATDYSFTEFTYIEMADFSKGQVEIYSRKWFGKDITKAEKFLVELRKEENKGVRDLGRSPLLLSMICLAYNETLTIPKRRVELYEEALDALLKKWDSSRNIQRDEVYKDLSLGRKRQMFARIAAETFEKGEIFFTKKQLAKSIETYLNNLPLADDNQIPDGEIVLRSIEAQHGIFVELAQGIYAFAHLTFQEYYTAKYITDNAHAGTLTRLIEHLTESRWREVFILTASLLDEATPFLKLMHIYAQKTIMDNGLLGTQKEVLNKANQTKNFNIPAKRSLYWYILLFRDRALDRAQDRMRDENAKKSLEIAQDQACNLALELCFSIDPVT
ncbi:NACHT domain-containing protein [Patescibacteria group bacterium]|nr:NACHT domain-containing protein [Patescibacteria group bacterium]